MDERKDEDRPMVSISGSTFIQCFDTNSGWVAGRTSNPKKLVCHLLALSAQYVGSIYASLGRLSKVCCCSPCWQEILIDCCNSGGHASSATLSAYIAAEREHSRFSFPNSKKGSTGKWPYGRKW